MSAPKMPLWPLLILQPLSVVAYQYLAKALGEGLGAGTPAQICAHMTSSPLFWALILIEGVGLVVWLAILSRIDLARAFPLTAISYCLVMAVSLLVFHETVDAFTVAGSLLILVGIGLLATDRSQG